MFPASRTARARIAAITVAVLTALSVAVPLLDRGRDPGTLALAEPGTPLGQVDHDHAVCLLHGAAVWSPAAGTDLPSERLVAEADTRADTDDRSGRSSRFLHYSRAPPLV